MYKFYSEQIDRDYTQNPQILNQFGFRRMRGIRKDIISLFTQFVKTADPAECYQKFLPGFVELLQIYK